MKADEKYKYIPIKQIGKGTYGKAYLVECTADNSQAVIKMIPIDLLSDQAKKEAYLETKILEKLNHPNIIKFREVFVTKPPNITLHLVMDYAEGGDLQKRIINQKNKYFQENQILDWFTQICLAVKHIHDRKILHRDIKSQNIFLTKNNMVKLGDFGIAKCLSYTLQQVQTITGTPYYLSPEIVLNKPYSFKSDIWSLGVVLYEMCALKLPFNAQSLPKLSLNIIKGVFNPMPSHYSKDLKLLVSNMLQLDPNKRPSICEILRYGVIKSRIKGFLSEMEYNKEFSHTILHKFDIFTNHPNSHEIKRKEGEKRFSSSNVHNDYFTNNKFNKQSSGSEEICQETESRKKRNSEKNYYVIEKGGDLNSHRSSNSSNIDLPANRCSSQVSAVKIDKISINKNNSSNNTPSSENTNHNPLAKKADSMKALDEKKKSLSEITNFFSSKNKKNIKINEVKNNPPVENKKLNISPSPIKSPVMISPQPTLKEFIDTMHEKIQINNNNGPNFDNNQENNQNQIENSSNLSNISNVASHPVNNKNEMKDLINTHRMLIELSCMEDENAKTLDSENSQIEELNVDKININLTNEFKTDHFTEESLNCGDIKIELDSNSKGCNEEIEVENGELEIMKKHLEEELGKALLSETPENELKIDTEVICKIIDDRLRDLYKSEEIDKANDRILEIWSLVVKERQENFINC